MEGRSLCVLRERCYFALVICVAHRQPRMHVHCYRCYYWATGYRHGVNRQSHVVPVLHTRLRTVCLLTLSSRVLYNYNKIAARRVLTDAAVEKVSQRSIYPGHGQRRVPAGHGLQDCVARRKEQCTYGYSWSERTRITKTP